MKLNTFFTKIISSVVLFTFIFSNAISFSGPSTPSFSINTLTSESHAREGAFTRSQFAKPVLAMLHRLFPQSPDSNLSAPVSRAELRTGGLSDDEKRSLDRLYERSRQLENIEFARMRLPLQGPDTSPEHFERRKTPDRIVKEWDGVAAKISELEKKRDSRSELRAELVSNLSDDKSPETEALRNLLREVAEQLKEEKELMKLMSPLISASIIGDQDIFKSIFDRFAPQVLQATDSSYTATDRTQRLWLLGILINAMDMISKEELGGQDFSGQDYEALDMYSNEDQDYRALAKDYATRLRKALDEIESTGTADGFIAKARPQLLRHYASKEETMPEYWDHESPNGGAKVVQLIDRIFPSTDPSKRADRARALSIVLIADATAPHWDSKDDVFYTKTLEALKRTASEAANLEGILSFNEGALFAFTQLAAGTKGDKETFNFLAGPIEQAIKAAEAAGNKAGQLLIASLSRLAQVRLAARAELRAEDAGEVTIFYIVHDRETQHHPGQGQVAHTSMRVPVAIVRQGEQAVIAYIRRADRDFQALESRAELRREFEQLLEQAEQASRPKIVAGNHKAQVVNRDAVKEIISNIAEGLKTIPNFETLSSSKVEVVVAVTHRLLSVARDYIDQLEKAGQLSRGLIQLAAQDMSPEEPGAHTGQTVYTELQEERVKYVILGHSERRRPNPKVSPEQDFAETSALINRKVLKAVEKEFHVIVPVGEELAERQAGNTNSVIEFQTRASLAGLTPEQIANQVTLAYEPVWAIGEGRPAATPEQADEAQRHLRGVILKMAGVEAASKIQIQYGGNVKPENAEAIFKKHNVDGALIGGASHKSSGRDFVEIIKIATDVANEPQTLTPARKVRLANNAKKMVTEKGGVIANDESVPSMTKWLEPMGRENDRKNRQDARRVIMMTEGVAGLGADSMIVDRDTMDNVDQDDKNLIKTYLLPHGINPVLKTDAGLGLDTESPLVPDVKNPGQKVHKEQIPKPKGLEELSALLAKYADSGIVGTKWRVVTHIDPANGLPTDENIRRNMKVLAKSAKITQLAGLVPMVEPEILLDGDHDIAASYSASTRALTILFEELANEGVFLPGIILKTSMVLSGKSASNRADAKTVGFQTLKALLKTVPAEVPAVVFLSGGQGDDEVNRNQNEVSLANRNRFGEARHWAMAELVTEGKDASHVNQLTKIPWRISFSYGRGLVGPAYRTWAGKPENVAAAQEALRQALEITTAASLGRLEEHLAAQARAELRLETNVSSTPFRIRRSELRKELAELDSSKAIAESAQAELDRAIKSVKSRSVQPVNSVRFSSELRKGAVISNGVHAATDVEGTTVQIIAPTLARAALDGSREMVEALRQTGQRSMILFSNRAELRAFETLVGKLPPSVKAMTADNLDNVRNELRAMGATAIYGIGFKSDQLTIASIANELKIFARFITVESVNAFYSLIGVIQKVTTEAAGALMRAIAA